MNLENHELLKDKYVAYLANGRENLAVTKTRGLVRGGGKKPWRQKGTGRARFGSNKKPYLAKWWYCISVQQVMKTILTKLIRAAKRAAITTKSKSCC